MKKAAFRVCHPFLEQIMDGDIRHVVSLESPEWIEWLENHHLFSFESVDGKFTARKEQRSGHWYWYAYRRVGGILSTAYLGRSQDLTFERLQAIAQTFTAQSAQPSFQESHASTPSSPLELTPQDMLLLTKLQIPPFSPRLLPRPSLIERLTADVSHPLVLLSAPAGSGKTTLLSEWAAGCRFPVAWVSLDDGDNDPVRFWRYMIAALEAVHKGCGTHALALLRTPQAVSLEAVVTVLMNAITSFPLDMVLILDDYHVIRAQAIHHTLTFLLEHAPPSLHLVITSRVDPPLPLPRFRVHSRMAEWRSADLRFTPHETAEFLARTAGVELAPEMVANVDSLTEGWVAGLQLTAISLQRTPLALDSFDLPQSSSLPIPHTSALFAYLAHEVWQRQPGHIQRFLLKAALVERVNASLCNALTGHTNGQQMLELIERANLFLMPVDHQQCWYRFHPLFRSFLLEQLSLLPHEKVQTLHLRACRWYERHGLITEAVPHALLSGDELLASQLVITAGQTLVRHQEMATVLQWLDTLPTRLVWSHPRLCLLRAWTQITSGQSLASSEWVQRAWQQLQERDRGDTEQARSSLPCPPEELRALEGEIAMLRSHLAVFRGDIPHALAEAQHALALLPETDLFLRSLGELNRGVSHWLNNEIQSASQALTRAEVLGQTAANTYVILTALCILTHVQIGQGQLQLASHTNHQALQLAREKRGESLWATACLLISQGQLYYLWNDLEAAAHSVQEGISLSTRWHHYDMLIYGYTVMAQIKQAQGDSLAALRLVYLAEQAIPANHPPPWLVSIMGALQMQLALMQKNSEAIEHWQQTQLCNYVRTFEQLALAHIALAHHESERALGILEREAERARGCGRFGTLIDVLVLQTIAYQQQHATQQAFAILEQALALAEPEGYIRPFVNGGPLVKALLEEALAPGGKTFREISFSYLHRLLAAHELPTDIQAEAKSLSQPLPTTGEIQERLSPREIDILSLIIAGCSTQEIAQRFIIAPTTVRWHIRNIYSKLHVHNRAQLVSRAHTLGISVHRVPSQKEGGNM